MEDIDNFSDSVYNPNGIYGRDSVTKSENLAYKSDVKLQEGDCEEAFSLARKAKEHSQKEKQIVTEAEDIKYEAETGIPGGNPEEALELLDELPAMLAKGDVDEAEDTVSEANESAFPDVEELAERGSRRAEMARSLREKNEFSDSINAWEDALEEYEKAAKRAESEGEEQELERVSKSINIIKGNRENTVKEWNYHKMRELVEEGEELIRESNDHYSDEDARLDEYKQAREGYEEAVSKYQSALEIADEHDFDISGSLERTIAELEESISDCVFSEMEERLRNAGELASFGEYDKAVKSFDDLLNELQESVEHQGASESEEGESADESDIEHVLVKASESQKDEDTHGRESYRYPANREDSLSELENIAKMGRVRSRIEKINAEIDKARNLFKDGDYEEARDAFQEAEEKAEQTLELSDEYGLVSERRRLGNLIDLCANDANKARRGMYGIGESEPELTSPEDITERQDRVVETPEMRKEVGEGIRNELPGHEVIERVGSGGNADVHKVRLEDSGEISALKIPHWQGTLPKETMEKFVDEAETWSKLDDHENIVEVIDWGSVPYPWMLLEYMQTSLDDVYEESPLPELTDMLIDVSNALEYAHGRGVVHLDIKPENVLINIDDGLEVKLSDWGLADVLLRNTKTMAGLTPPYSAPEQLTEKRGGFDRRTDVYQLGALAYEVFTGRKPFESDHPAELQNQILTQLPSNPSDVNPDVPRELDNILLKALAKDKEDRYETVILFREDLISLQDSGLLVPQRS